MATRKRGVGRDRSLMEGTVRSFQHTPQDPLISADLDCHLIAARAYE